LGNAGLLVPAGDPQAIAAHVRRLLAEPATRRELGQAARDRYLANYTPELYDRRLRALFAELLG
jgi:glycosyltransferase involved in cell wall biosynthesis